MERSSLSEILGALSLATDLAEVQPQGSAMYASVMAVRIGRLLGLDDPELSELYYACLMRFFGCTAIAADLAPVSLGEEQRVNHSYTIGDPLDREDIRHHLGRPGRAHYLRRGDGRGP